MRKILIVVMLAVTTFCFGVDRSDLLDFIQQFAKQSGEGDFSQTFNGLEDLGGLDKFELTNSTIIKNTRLTDSNGEVYVKLYSEDILHKKSLNIGFDIYTPAKKLNAQDILDFYGFLVGKFGKPTTEVNYNYRSPYIVASRHSIKMQWRLGDYVINFSDAYFSFSGKYSEIIKVMEVIPKEVSEDLHPLIKLNFITTRVFHPTTGLDYDFKVDPVVYVLDLNEHTMMFASLEKLGPIDSLSDTQIISSIKYPAFRATISIDRVNGLFTIDYFKTGTEFNFRRETGNIRLLEETDKVF